MSNAALCAAAQHGHGPCVELLIPVSEAKTLNEYSSPLVKAAEYGHTNCVKLLIPVTEEIWIHLALCMAVDLKHIDCVTFLMGACDPKNNLSLALRLPVKNKSQ